MNTKKGRLIIFITFGILILIAFANVFYQDAYSFQKQALEEVSTSAIILTEIETLAIPLAEEIPLVKEWAHSFEKDFDKLLNYLNITSILVGLQLTILGISKWIFLKIIMVLLFIGLFFVKLRPISMKLLILCLILSPGLNIYTKLMQYTVHASEMDLGNELHTHLQTTKDSIKAKGLYHQEKLQKLKNKQAKENKGRLTFFDKIEDEAIKSKNHIVDGAEKIGKETLEILRFTAKNSVKIGVKLMVNVIVIFILLPVLFWYTFSLVFKSLF